MKYYEDGLIYDTNKCELIAETSKPIYDDDGYLGEETIRFYITKNKRFFRERIASYKGPWPWSKLRPPKYTIRPLSKTAFVSLLQYYHESEIANAYANDLLEEA